ncbi:MAG: PDZ domain-containing protein [Oscillospiraceae bacterium]|nr:PDZ domain-containing protein [Oscillospiraceae bacterium]
MKEKILRILSYALVAAGSTFMTLAMLHHEVDLTTGKLEQLEELIEERFIGEADLGAMEDAAAEAMVAATGDRWSYYIPASEYTAYLERMENAYVGVGITIQVTQEQKGFLILDVTAGSPAEEAGLQVEDLIVAVEGQDIRMLDITEVREKVRGAEGTYVTMTIQRGGEEADFSVERRKVETPVATGQMLEGSVGLVTIANFDSRCAQETIAAIDGLLAEGAQKLIFDVRHNPGGYASELVEVLDYLLPEGELFRTVRYDGKENVDMSDADFLDIPMAVLVNADSYSAAEFFAAALRDYEAAVIVGEQTVGKGYFQTTYRLDDGSAVALSIGEYFTPKGKNLAEVGVTPDVVVPVDEETADAIYFGVLTPEKDPQIEAAIRALR